MRLWHGAALLLLLTACGRREPAEVRSEQAASISVDHAWSWHPLGGLAVVEGELGEPMELLLEGRSIKERRFAEAGPVRWEFFRPPEGEEAVLRAPDGRELARFTFKLAPSPRAEAPPRLARHTEPVPAAPLQGTPLQTPQTQAPPKVRAGARLQSPPVRALPERKDFSVPAPATGVAALRPRAWLRQLFSRPEPGSTPSPEPSPGTPNPNIRTEARLTHVPVSPIPDRQPVAMPHNTPGQAAAPMATSGATSGLGAATLPVVPAADSLQATKPVTPPASLVTPLTTPLMAPRMTPHMTSAPLSATGAAAWPGMGEGLNLTRAPGGRKRILLSFDGGSSDEVTTEVLDLLKARGVRTTLFLTGAFIKRFPAQVRRMAAEGHELGNHTMNHPHFAPDMKRDPQWTRERIRRELLDADAALVRLLGRPMDPYWRAPYGEHTAEIRKWAEELGYRHVGWSEGADTLDWATPKDRRLYRSGEAIVQRLQQRLNKNGDGIIVLMHLGSARATGDRPTDGLGAFMDQAQAEGWTFVSAGTILRDLGKPTWDPQQRLAWLTATSTQAR